MLSVTVSALTASAQVCWSLVSETGALAVKAGDEISAQLTLEIRPGWHISSITQPTDGPMRTEIALVAGSQFKLAGPITGPKPAKKHSAAFGMEVESYSCLVIFKLHLIATEDIKPGTKLTVEITYQACNDETCLLPKTEKVSCIIGEPKSPAEKPPSLPARKS